MSRNIGLSDELYERLERQAARQGQTIEGYLERLIVAGVFESESEDKRETRERALVRDRLLAQGLLVTWPGPRRQVPEHPPIKVRGTPLSRTVIEDRR